MAQLDRPQRRESPRTTPNSPTIQQLVRDGEASWWRREPEEEQHGHQLQYHQKKSVLAKVREKAKKLKHSLSLKKKHSDHIDENATPSWGVSLEDDDHDQEEEDAEYLRAPMYESEFAPESYKATARQHPRAVPVISEKHVLSISTSEKEAKADQNPHSPNDEPNQTKPDDEQSIPLKTIITDHKLLTPALETMAEKLGPTYNSLTSKIQGLTGATTNSPTTEPSHNSNINDTNSSPLPSQISTTSPQKSAPPQPVAGIWDKGVSVRDYLLNKFEPAEEDRALSRAISEAMIRPRSANKKNISSSNSTSESSGNCTSDHEPRVVEKVREAVASLLRNDQPRSPPSKPAVLTRSVTKTSMPRHIPISTNAREVEEEENLGRILQTN